MFLENSGGCQGFFSHSRALERLCRNRKTRMNVILSASEESRISCCL
jgi:hypothetical protein